MGRYMAELGITPASRSRVRLADDKAGPEPVNIVFRWLDSEDEEVQPDSTVKIPPGGERV